MKKNEMYELIAQELSKENKCKNRVSQTYCASLLWVIALVGSVLMIQDKLVQLFALIVITVVWLNIMRSLPWGKVMVPTDEEIKFRAKIKLTETSDKSIVYQLRNLIDS